MGTRSELGVEVESLLGLQPVAELPTPSGNEPGTSALSGNEPATSDDAGSRCCTPDLAAGADGVSLSGIDIFIRARANRAGRLPPPLRRGRHARAATLSRAGARPALHSANDRATTPQWVHLVDVDGDAESARIELRRRFEDDSDAPWMPDTRASVAG